MTFIKADVAREESVEQWVALTVERYGRVDVMVNNAGIDVLNVTHELIYEDYHKVVSINQDGVFFSAKHAIKTCWEMATAA